VDELDAPNHPNDPSLGTRKIPLSRVVYIERDDFSEDPPGKWFRLAPGREVRLRNACLITCTGVIKDPDTGEVTELRCSWDPDSRGGAAADGRKVKGTLHWVSAEHAIEMKVKLFDRLFRVENPMANKENFLEAINPDSLEILSGCWIEPSFATAQAGDCFQLERLGYFRVESTGDAAEPLTLLRTVSLRDTWAKTAKKQGRKG
jgi:glutaminyl-tRNA synthetase